MAQEQLLKFETFVSSGEPKRDIEQLTQMLAKVMNDVYAKLPSGATGTITTANVAAGLVTVDNGTVQQIS